MPAKVTITFKMDHPHLPGLPLVIDWPSYLGLVRDGVPMEGITELEVDVENLEPPT